MSKEFKERINNLLDAAIKGEYTTPNHRAGVPVHEDFNEEVTIYAYKENNNE